MPVFFAFEAMIGPALGQGLADGPFGGAVGRRDRIEAALSGFVVDSDAPGGINFKGLLA